MKKIINLFVFVGLVAVLMTYSSCGPKPAAELPVTDQLLQKLLSTTSTSGAGSTAWKCSSAKVNGVDKTANYTTSFLLTLSGSIGALATSPFQYTTSKPTYGQNDSPVSPWAASGTFTFDATSPSTIIKRDDGTSITYTASDTQLTMSFTFSGAGFLRGRAEIVTGQWDFTFTK